MTDSEVWRSLVLSRVADDPDDPILYATTPSAIRLPRDLTDRAARASYGGYAWRREDLPEAFRAIAEAGGIIRGGDLWVIQHGLIYSVLPSPVPEGWPGVWGWTTQPRGAGESIEGFRNRSVKEGMDLLSDLWFSVIYATADRYP